MKRRGEALDERHDEHRRARGDGGARVAAVRAWAYLVVKRSETVRNGQKRSRVDEKGVTHQNEPSSPVPRRLFHMN